MKGSHPAGLNLNLDPNLLCGERALLKMQTKVRQNADKNSNAISLLP
jgi:hypothetical protein